MLCALWQVKVLLPRTNLNEILVLNTSMSGERIFEQESPPAWTQEAYRPPCSEYSFCCPTRVPPPGGVPDPGTPPGGTRTPPPRGGTRTPPGGVPDPGTPPGGVPAPPPGGVPGPPQGTLTQVPPPGGYPDPPPGGVPDPGTAPGGGTWTPPPPGGDLTRVPPPPPRVDRQTKWNYYLPVVLRTRAVKISIIAGLLESA